LSDLLHDIADALKADYGMKPSPDGKFLRQGVCPQCQKKELWTYAATPWVVKCARANKCGAEYHAKELYPDFFESWTERFQKAEDAKPEAERNPHAAADAYLRMARGFDLSLIKGLYTQETYFDQKADHGRGASTATVRFEVANTWWQRLIDKPARFGSKKATFKFGGSYAGHWWALPTLSFAAPRPDAPADAAKPPKELWLCEGIFDAIALAHAGIAAVSLMSCNNYPEHALAALRAQIKREGNQVPEPVLVWALDTGKAGESFTVKHVARARADGWECKAAQPPKGKNKLDWNDLHQRDQLTEKHREQYLYQGALLIAATAKDKALLIYNKTGQNSFHFVHAHQWFWFKLDYERFNKAVLQIEADIKDGTRKDLDKDALREAALIESHTLQPICSCNPQMLYYQGNEITQEAWYYFRVTFPTDQPTVKGTFTAGQLVAAAEFKKQLLHMAPGALYTGNAAQLERIMQDQLKQPMVVQTVDFVGYSPKHKTYLLGDIAVNDGRVIEANEDDYFEIGRTSLKTLQKSIKLEINTDRSTYEREWLGHLWAAYGARGLVALSYWMGSLFAEQIRAEHRSYPFLEIVGAPNAGKTTLIKFLWRLLGRDGYEGFDPNKSSNAGRQRTFSQVSNLPIVLIESDRSGPTGQGPHGRAFDWDEMKDAYNGNPIRTTGVKTGGNETYEPPFRASLVIAQNAPIDASQAMMERICHIFFDGSHKTPENKADGEWIKRAGGTGISGFILEALKREKDILQTVFSQTEAEAAWLESHDGVHNDRLAFNHGQVLALSQALGRVVRLTDQQLAGVRACLLDMTRERQLTVSGDHPTVALFWETFDFLDSIPTSTTGGQIYTSRLNHSNDHQRIAVNLNEYLEMASLHRQQVPPLAELKKVLRNSKTRPFVDVKSVSSAITTRPGTDRGNPVPRTVHCWVFNRQKALNRAA
jgi:Toprim-like